VSWTRLTAALTSVGTGLTTHGGKFGLVLPIYQAVASGKAF
jgi:hypothetical protein